MSLFVNIIKKLCLIFFILQNYQESKRQGGLRLTVTQYLTPPSGWQGQGPTFLSAPMNRQLPTPNKADFMVEGPGRENSFSLLRKTEKSEFYDSTNIYGFSPCLCLSLTACRMPHYCSAVAACLYSGMKSHQVALLSSEWLRWYICISFISVWVC